MIHSKVNRGIKNPTHPTIVFLLIGSENSWCEYNWGDVSNLYVIIFLLKKEIDERWLTISERCMLWRGQFVWCKSWCQSGCGGGTGGDGSTNEGLAMESRWSSFCSSLCCSSSCSGDAGVGKFLCRSQSMGARPCLSTYDCINWSKLSRKPLRRRFETLLLPKKKPTIE